MATLLSLSARIGKWVVDVLGRDALFDRRERVLRLLEEATELAQAEGITHDEANNVVAYVMNRPVGVIEQETGGMLVCALAYCYAAGFDPYKATEAEVARIEAADANKIRAKHAAKIHAGIATPRKE